MKKILIGVDIQNDFITGSLRVDSAESKMNALADYLNNKQDYSVVLMTMDWHPYNHCSFKDNGGEWPVHCVKYSVGAALYNPVYTILNEKGYNVKIYTKGEKENKEEYTFTDSNASKESIRNIIYGWRVDQIDIAGIVGTICVKNTINGLIQMGYKDKINVLTKYVANFDDDTEFKTWLDEEGIRYE